MVRKKFDQLGTASSKERARSSLSLVKNFEIAALLTKYIDVHGKVSKIRPDD
jgi:hypothetical protein